MESFLQNFDLNSFLSGSGIGAALAFVIKSLFSKWLDLRFARENIGYNKLQDRYEKLYSPLRHQLMGLTIESYGNLPLKTKLTLIVDGLLSGNFKYAWNEAKIKNESDKEFYLGNLSAFDLDGVRKHIRKYHQLADIKLVDLLDAAIASENERKHDELLEQSRGGIYLNNGLITPQVYNLIDHIYKYNRYLSSKTNPK